MPNPRPLVSGGTESRRRARGPRPYGLLYAIEPQYRSLGRIPAPLKIGYTRDLESLARRLANLQTSHWLELAVVWVATGNIEAERLLHRELRDAGLHVRGEWFDNGPETWMVLERLAPRREAA